ncbi:hypothetical protein HI914_04933 [Erysiphe necator]|nr:hypothetical protein HI914_04933 [Erysiphe necator]
MASKPQYSYNLRSLSLSPTKTSARQGGLPRTPPTIRPSHTSISDFSRPPGSFNQSFEEVNEEEPEVPLENSSDLHDLLEELRQMKIRLEKAEKKSRQAEKRQQQQAEIINCLQEKLSSREFQPEPQPELTEPQYSVETKFKDREESSSERKATVSFHKHESPHDFRQKSEFSSRSFSTRIESVPHIPEDQKLGSGNDVDAQVWHRDMTNRLRWYDDRFFDREQKFEYVYGNTKGDAAKLARSYRLDPPLDWTAQDFVDFLTQTFDNPAKRETATAEFEGLLMSPQESFWNFWRRFRTISSDAEYRDDRFLREQMRAKVLVRLSNVVQLEWDRCQNLNEYVNILQKADAHFQATQLRQKRRAGAVINASQRPFLSSSPGLISSSPKSTYQTTRSMNFRNQVSGNSNNFETYQPILSDSKTSSKSPEPRNPPSYNRSNTNLPNSASRFENRQYSRSPGH